MYKQKFYAKSVTIAKETDKIKELAERVGIVLPSIHTALFQSIFAPIDEANLNGVRLANEVAEEEIKKMIGANANMEHMGYGWIVGIILDAWINEENEIEIIYSFAKNIYEDEYVLALEALEKSELSVSFELLADTDKQEKLDDGTLLLHDYNFTGVGVLISNPPAYPKAKTYEYAKVVKSRVSSCNKELVFASKITKTCDDILSKKEEEDILAKQTKIEKNQGGNKKVTKEQEKQIEEIRAELGDLAKEVSDEDLLNEEKVAELREVKESEKAKKEKEIAYKVDSVEIRTFSLEEKDGVETVVESIDIITKRDYNAMKEAVAKVEELEASLEAKNSEIEAVRENAEKIGKTKVQLKDNEFAKNFTDEDLLDDEKVAKAIQDQKDAEIVATRKEELKENKYAEKFSDEDYLNDTKVELAEVKKEKDELEATKDKKKDKKEASKKVEVDPNMNTGDADVKDDYKKVMASVRKDRTDKKETIKVYTK